jgi:hypothetical protein
VEISTDYGIMPVKPELCPFTEKTIGVDGDLSEWDGFPFKGNSQSYISGEPDGYSGDFDGSYEYAVGYDTGYLYVALSIWDDQLITDVNRSLHDRDEVSLFLDARPARESANNRGQNNYTDNLFLDFSLPGSRKEKPVVAEKEKLPQQLRISARKTVQGADVEIAIPVVYLNAMNGKEWHDFRLNLVYFDRDQGEPVTAIWWRPDWSSKDNYIGSGTFFRDFSKENR